jgi:hypothetical protein
MSDSVTTLDLFSESMVMRENGSYYFPRWLSVQIERRVPNGKAWGCLVGFKPHDPVELTIHRCRCGNEFATRHYTFVIPLCRACDRQKLTERQRRSRARRRARKLRNSCVLCGNPLDAARTTKKFCSGACRTADLRQRRKRK